MATTVSVESTPGGGTYVDLTSYLLQNTLTVKVNALDFTLNAPPAGSTQLGAGVRLTDPTWAGTVSSAMSFDPVDLRNGIEYVNVTAANTDALLADTAPFDLSDVPTTVALGVYQAEDGSTFELEDGTDFAPGNYELEGALSYGYSGLSVRTSVNSDPTGPPQTLGRCNVYQPGLRPGNIFALTSLNQGYGASPFEITQVTITWPGLAANPFYSIEFGDTPQTLAAWTVANATPAPPPVNPPVIIPPSTVVYGLVHITGTAGIRPMGEGIVTLATATFSFTGTGSGSPTCQVQGAVDALAYAWDDYISAPRRAVRATLSGGLFTGAWQELPGGWSGGSTAGFRTTSNLSSAAGIGISAGTYTVKIESDAQEYNQLQVFSGWVRVLITA